MIYWGMVGNSHDASLAVFKDGLLVWASTANKFSDVPNDPKHSPIQIQTAIQSYGKPDLVVWYENPWSKSFRQWMAGQGSLFGCLKENNIDKYLADLGIYCPVKYMKHHHSHAAYGYYTQHNPAGTAVRTGNSPRPGSKVSVRPWHRLPGFVAGWCGLPGIEGSAHRPCLRTVPGRRYPL